MKKQFLCPCIQGLKFGTGWILAHRCSVFPARSETEICLSRPSTASSAAIASDVSTVLNCCIALWSHSFSFIISGSFYISSIIVNRHVRWCQSCLYHYHSLILLLFTSSKLLLHTYNKWPLSLQIVHSICGHLFIVWPNSLDLIQAIIMLLDQQAKHDWGSFHALPTNQPRSQGLSSPHPKGSEGRKTLAQAGHVSW